MKIKYDRSTNKILLITTIVSGLLVMVGLFCLFLNIDGTELIMLAGIGGGGLFLFSGLNLFAGLCYIHRLQIYGYEIPYKKSDYNDNLQNVPHVNRQFGAETKKNIESRILFFLYIIVYLMANVWNMYYIVHWYKYVDSNATFLFFVQFIFDSYWLISASIFYRQRNTEKYRDDVELDAARKERTSMEKGIIVCVIILFFMVYIKMIITNMSDYIFHSRAEHDQMYLERIQGEISRAMQEETSIYSTVSYKQMSLGCYISDWTKPGDEFSKAIAVYLGISDFSDLKNKIFNSDGKPKIYVKISGEDVYVRMENPLRVEHGIQYSYEASDNEMENGY